ncbi:hypothetical protein KC19_4G098100 [Ceratodon purpureus]|uniref:Uncharacterized protein n=1 Tax=Ceratodon purpureus TaxID=3225 RepID=A0A8T0I8P7_CERPU|nr:hypothetical protein KC19_4G098100 [Ceratodon purpureus]
MENREGYGHPATNAEGTTTMHPESNLQPGDPNLVGGAPADEKKGITGKVKDMVGRHGRKKHNHDAPGSAKGGFLHKIKAKAGSKVGHGEDGSKHGPARLLSMSSSSSSLSSSDEEDIGTVGFAMDPTGPAVAGETLGREDFTNAPEGPGADFRDLNLDSDDDANGDEIAQHSERAAEYAKISNPMNPEYGKTLTRSEDDTHGESHHSLRSETSDPYLTPSEDDHGEQLHHSHQTHTGNSNQSASDYSEPHVSNFEGEAATGDHHGNLDDGPRGDSLKQEGFAHKIMNKVF